MLSNSPSSFPTRRTLRAADRRSRRRPVLVTTCLTLGLVATTAFTAVTPSAQTGGDVAAAAPNFARVSYTTPIEPVSSVRIAGTDEVASAASEALSAAEQTLSAADTVTSDIAASGLDIGVPDPTVDTSELEEVTAQLDAANDLPSPFLPGITAEVEKQTSAVDARVAELRGGLEGAQARKAEEEAAAAEAARLEAEAAAKAKAEANAAAAARNTSRTSSSPSGSSGGSTPAPAPKLASGGSAAEAQATARAMLSGHGWGDDQFSCLVSLWNKESGWNYRASNPSSGAYGIPQALPGSKMASAGADWQTNPATQIAWGFGYISGRYGTPCGAWSHSQSVGWY